MQPLSYCEGQAKVENYTEQTGEKSIVLFERKQTKS